MPQRHSGHRKEDKSKREFEDQIDPYFVQGWNIRDYGIDCIVDITTSADVFGHAELESKCFFVQLKSSEKIRKSKTAISFSIEVKKITYWYSYNLPVLFVLYDIESKGFYYLWIDEMLIADLDSQKSNWALQKSVTVKIPTANKLAKKKLPLLKDHVLKWKMATRRKLEPGKYFELRERGGTCVNSYKKIIQPFNFNSVHEAIRSIETDLDLSLYRIALTGLSRAGKSSIINGLLRKEVSPTGFFQTTGVPIQIIPGVEDKISISFNKRATAKFPFSIDQVQQYASQDHNPDNKKDVNLISISIKNKDLERGVSLFDIPGLDDPSEEVLNYTMQIVKKANAIVYVIDASPAEDGGYIFKSDYKRHINSFRDSQDKVFLVFNKVDKLSPDTLLKLKERVVTDLNKYGLTDVIGDKIFYLSARNMQACGDYDTVKGLNEQIWDFILAENKSGIVKLSLINQELFKNTKTLVEILNARLLDNDRKIQLQSAINEVRKKAALFTNDTAVRQQELRKLIMDSIDMKSRSILDELEQNLKSVPSTSALPTSGDVKKYLISKASESIEKVNGEYLVKINRLKHETEVWMEQNFKRLREILKTSSKNKIVDFTELDSFELPQVDYSSAWGMGFIGMAAAYLVAPAFMIGAGLVGFFGNLFTTAESRRSKQISRIIEKARGNYVPVFKKIKNGYLEILHDHIQFLNQQFAQKLTYYFQDIEQQISQLNSDITKKELEAFKMSFKKIEKLQEKLVDFDAELRSYLFTS